MAFLSKLTTGLKSAMRFGGYGYGGSILGGRGYLTSSPGSSQDFTRLAGDLSQNAVVALALRWYADQFFEPDLQVQKRLVTKNENKVIVGHPMVGLIDDPNPAYDAITMMGAVVNSYLTDGNAYLQKVRNDGGEVVQLWWLPHWQVVPVRNNEYDYVSYYQRTFEGGTSRIEPEDLVHFRYGLDPYNQMRGISPLRSVIREVVGDNAASTYSTALLLNQGAVPYLITPGDKDGTIDAEDAQTYEKKLDRTTGDGSGRSLIFSSHVNVTKLGLSPEDLALDKIRDVPEDRITAALGLNAMCLGLTSGANAKTYANYAAAVQASYHAGLIPLQTRIAETLYRQLLPDFESDVKRHTVRWDYSAVQALQESQDAVAKRQVLLFNSDLITRATVLTSLGMDSGPEDDVYHHQIVVPEPAPVPQDGS